MFAHSNVQGEKQDLLFISTERYKFCVLAYDAEKQLIETRANGDIEVSKREEGVVEAASVQLDVTNARLCATLI